MIEAQDSSKEFYLTRWELGVLLDTAMGSLGIADDKNTIFRWSYTQRKAVVDKLNERLAEEIIGVKPGPVYRSSGE